jgi:superfamily II DNA or RNA helicase
LPPKKEEWQMSEEAKSKKVVLLLQPQKMLHRRPVVQILKVERNGNAIEMDEYAITSASLSQYFKHIDQNARRELLKFSEFELVNENKRIAGTLKKLSLRPGEADRHKDRAMARYFQLHLGFLKQYSHEISWYHRVTQPGSNRIPTAPCTYHPISVQLVFDCLQEGGRINLKTSVKTREGVFPLDQFRRFYFLLLKENNYYHISLAGYEALEWLEDQHIDRYKKNADLFIEKIALPLKKFQQTVNFDSLIEKDRLEVVPVKRVLLSELNKTFLMITPQYVYDGYIIEGPFSETYEQKTAGKPLLIQRDETTEQSFNEYLRALHPNFTKQHNGYFYLTFADAQKKHWFINIYHQLLNDDVELVGMDLLRHFRYSTHKAETTMKLIGQEGEIIKVEMKLAFGKEKVPLNELQKMLLNGQKVVLLKDGSMGVLGEDWLQQYGPVVKHAKVKGNELLVPRWMAMSMGENEADLQIRRTLPGDWLEKWNRWLYGSEAMYPIPSLVQVQQLRPYQQKGYDWMNLLAEAGGSACLADDMGLGKTLQTICFIANRLHKNPSGKHLVVCPASLIYNWQQEFEKFAGSVGTVAYHGTTRSKEWLTDKEHSVIITSYGTMRQDIETLEAWSFDVVVIDESHHIKNPSTKISRAVGQLLAGTRIALSGTPVMNGTMDLYAQLNFLLPGLLGSREFFNKEYIIPIEQQRDEEKAKALQKLIAPFVLRRTKEQVAPDLPPKTETVLWCSMGHDQKAAYESIKENIRSSVLLDIEQNGLNKGKMSVLAGLMKLRQACNSCELVKGEDLFTYDSIKTEILIEELKNIVPLHRALVFSQFTTMLDLLERDLDKAGIKYQRLDGSTAIQERQELVNSFQQPETDVQVFLLSLKAGNAGLTLTAADYVFLFDPWWNVAVENQAIDRTHRIGQDKQVFAYRMICKGTIEEKILRMQERKKKLAEELVSTDEGFIKGLTEEDIRYLFE